MNIMALRFIIYMKILNGWGHDLGSKNVQKSKFVGLFLSLFLSLKGSWIGFEHACDFLLLLVLFCFFTYFSTPDDFESKKRRFEPKTCCKRNGDYLVLAPLFRFKVWKRPLHMCGNKCKQMPLQTPYQFH